MKRRKENNRGEKRSERPKGKKQPKKNRDSGRISDKKPF